MSKDKNQVSDSADQRPIPSQAEGDTKPQSGTGTRPRPSQAEGDRETVEESLRQQEEEEKNG